jgi:hypothetical protein
MVQEVNREKSRIFKDNSGISLLVATVILIAVTIVVVVAVAYWMGGIAVLYTRFEKLQIISAYATWNATSNQTGQGSGEWKIIVTLRNTGSADATITGLYINGKPWDDVYFGGRILVPSGILPASLIPSGQPVSVTFYIAKGGGFNPGVSIEIKLHSASGQDYPTMITLS